MKKIIIGWIILLLLVALTLIFFIWQDSFSFLVTTGDKWLGTAIVLIVALVLSHLHNLIFLTLSKVVKFNFKLKDQSHIDTDDKKILKKKKMGPFSDAVFFLQQCFGFFWRRKISKCLVLGSIADTEQLLPNLTTERWQLSEKTLMIYGGDIQDEPDIKWFSAIKKSFGHVIGIRRKPIDAVVWILPADYLQLNRRQQINLEKMVLQMQARNKAMGWQAPLYLVDTRNSEWNQDGRTEQAVGVLFPERKKDKIATVSTLLSQLGETCCIRGVQQIKTDPRYAFLLQLSQDLVVKDSSRLKRYITHLLSAPKSPLLQGLFFTPIQSRLDTDEEFIHGEHHLTLSPTWRAIFSDAKKQRGRRIGIQWETMLCSVLLGAMILVGAGLMTSYYHNRELIMTSQQLVQQIENTKAADYSARLHAQYDLQLKMAQLLYRKQEGVPTTYRFGLSQNDPLLDMLWPHYQHINQLNISEPFYLWTSDYLARLVAMSPADPQRIKWTNSGYDVLKAYLMLGQPERIDTTYLSDLANKMWQPPEPIDMGEWHKLMPELVTFWGQSLTSHPQWAESLNTLLIKDVRQILINQIGVQNAENTIYQAILQRAGQNYANLTLVQLLGDIDSRMLFSSSDEVPGVFTRKAWEDIVKNEIATAAKSRQEQIDWVLSDGSKIMTSSISPDLLRQHLTDRYFSDYSAAWLLFLNNIQWRQANNVADVIEQLTLMSDVRQSPLVALMNVVKYQGEVAYSGGGISDNLIRSAQELIHDKNPANLNVKTEASGPLTPTFGPVLNLLNADNSNGLSLQTYLLRVTQVRLKLQNITSSANPQAMAQALAKSVFQGSAVDLTDTRDYGNLIAANLGEEWSGFGYSLFKQPLEQAWQVILTPAANSFNHTWQTQIVYQWEKAFAGRYPFKNSGNEASLAELARFLRPDAGVIDRFIASELGGVLEKQGDNWVINPVNAQGLTFSPKFIDALNLFNELSNQLLASGDAKIAFDLMARSGYNVARSELIIDKQKLDYFNQMPVWQRFSWPGDGYSPFAQLSWSSDETGMRLYDYYAGDWAWIRLLESSAIRQIDSSRYEVVWQVSDKSKLKYILRSQSGEGPLTLLKLRNFSLPKNVFDIRKSEEPINITL